MINQKIGLALGGGGARGAAHLGVIKHFEELGLRPDALSGTSAGAIVAALYAFGNSLEDIKKDISQLKAAKVSSLRINELGLFANENLEKMLTQRLGADVKIEDATIPLAIQTTDIETGESVLITKGKLTPAVLASSCVPGIYIPQKIDGRILVDGGLSENVPLSGLRELNSQITIAVNLNGNENYRRPDSIIDILSNALDIAIDNQTRSQISEADIKISMDLTQYSRFQVEDMDKLLIEGEKSAKRALQTSRYIRLKHRFNRIRSRFNDITPLKVPNILRRRR